MTNRVLDINCDMGESFGNWKAGNDAAVMPKITTANIACGFHAGDPVTMMRTVELAMANKVAIGAHPGLPDLLGFGRRIMAVSPEEIYAYVAYQCQSAFKFDPRSASNFDPFWRRVLAGCWLIVSPAFEPPAVIAGFDDVAVMGQAIE